MDEERGHKPRGLVLPPLDVGAYLVEYLFEVGPGTGDGPITHQEIAAWCALTGREVEPWEVDALRRMSGAYLSEAHEATDPKRAPPAWESEQPTKEQVSNTIESLLSRWEAQDAKATR